MLSVPVIISLLIGVPLILLGLDLIFMPTIFKCDRLKNVCYRESRHLWSKGSKHENLCMLSEIKQAKLVSCVNDGTTMYHVVLELKNGDSLTIFNSSSSVRPEHEKNAEAINNFLKGGHKEMILKDSFVFGGIILIIFGITIFAVGGGLSSLFSVIETID